VSNCPNCVTSDAFRKAFTEAANKMGRVLEGRMQKLPKNWTPSEEDKKWSAAWGELFAMVRDSDAGLKLLAEFAKLKPYYREFCSGDGI